MKKQPNLNLPIRTGKSSRANYIKLRGQQMYNEASCPSQVIILSTNNEIRHVRTKNFNVEDMDLSYTRRERVCGGG